MKRGADFAALAIVLILCFCPLAAQAQKSRLVINNTQIHRPQMSVFVLPQESIKIISTGRQTLRFSSKDMQFASEQKGIHITQAPSESGIYQLEVLDATNAKIVQVSVVVMVPYEKMEAGYLEGYRIDDYPKKPLRGLENYKRPRGFVRITEDNLDQQLSSHFTFRQFLCKQQSHYPKFIVVSTVTLQMLESFLDFLNARGHDIDTFGVISAYRTPYYNRLIKNVVYSRHIYGDAMDLFIDKDKNGRMDDLNGDGKFNEEDVAVLYDLAKDFHKEKGAYIGGIGKYLPTSAHIDFIHMDNRGYVARW
jgi:hypothetical protein